MPCHHIPHDKLNIETPSTKLLGKTVKGKTDNQSKYKIKQTDQRKTMEKRGANATSIETALQGCQ